MSSEVVVIDHLSKTFVARQSLFARREIRALADVSLRLRRGRTLAVVGESGSGKSTLARLLMRLERPSGGNIHLMHEGRLTDIEGLPPRAFYRRVQMVFQDPYASMNPRKRVWQIVTKPLTNLSDCRGDELRGIAERELQAVGLGPQYIDSFPHQLSGGQRQRVSIARAMATRPEVLVLDEPLSALDVSIQAQILNLLLELQQRTTITSMFITHDLAVVRHIADDVAVLCAGRLVEYGLTEAIIGAPEHLYTRALVANMPGRGCGRNVRNHRAPRPQHGHDLPEPREQAQTPWAAEAAPLPALA
ncbi:MAG TPA: ATP-binding cassette domain-containing protein, partial [Lacipirellulaceae bacterium]|nr:ATP-binding cassette domain-containing protein [Lacipirellulaceae bacterium]